MSAGWATGLSVHDHPEWLGVDAPGDLGREGLVSVLVAAERGGSGPPLAALPDLARHLVLGAVAYARKLGFEPHPDFAAVARYLEPWTGPSAISFGRNGKPFYFQGPHDDAASIVKTLKRSVGRGNFDSMLVA